MLIVEDPVLLACNKLGHCSLVTWSAGFDCTTLVANFS